MNWSTFVTRGQKALRMPPRKLLGRLRDEVRQQTKRPWANVYPRLLSDQRIVGGSGAGSLDQLWDRLARDTAFFLRPEDRATWTSEFRARFPDEARALVAAAEAALRHEFNLLGSGPVNLGARFSWHRDFKTGREWPQQYWRSIEYLELDCPTDVKLPWELSRVQHVTTLGQAYWLTGDERYAAEFVGLTDDWIASNPLGYSVNWAVAMEVALRATSWVWGFYFMADSEACRSPEFRRRFLRSLFMHGEFTSRNLETSDINGNHYLSDAVGLVVLGIVFRHSVDGARWLAMGRQIVTTEILKQVMPDGVDHEGSIAYHRLVLELFLTAFLLLERAGDTLPAEAWDRLARMFDFVAAYIKPDGTVPFVGDSDDGRVQKLGTQGLNDHRYLLSTGAVRFASASLKAAAGELWSESFWMLGPAGARAFEALPVMARSPASQAFPDGGFYVLQNRAAHVFIDAAEVGMRGRGGHGHNDILSFELFMNGVNLVTDCGTYVYTASREWRNRFRSTAFHNTMQIDGQEMNRLIGPDALWQLHYDAVPSDVHWRFDSSGSSWRGSHLGYHRLAEPCQPHRALWLHPDEALLAVSDRVDGIGAHRVTWRWHLDPQCTVAIDGGDCRISHGRREFWMLPASAAPAPLRIDEGWVSPGYGVKTETRVIVLEAECAMPVSFSYIFADTRLDSSARARALHALAEASG